jgi:zinc protease
VIRANCLSSKFAETYQLVEEIIFEPRWDEKEFERLKNEIIESINRSKTSASTTASNVFASLVYGKDNILSNSIIGNEISVPSITIQDLKNYYDQAFDPQNTKISIAGNVSESVIIDRFKNLEKRWLKKGTEVKLPAAFSKYEKAKVYFIDFPGAKQSEIRIGGLGLPFTHPDYFKTTVMNYKLGGSFNGIVNLILREEKGYTYGARTNFSGYKYPGYFVASSGVQSNATLESVQIFQNSMNEYRNGISVEDLKFTKDALIKSNALRFETLGALRGMLGQIAKYDLPFNYIKLQEKQIADMSLEEHKMLAQMYINPEKMIYLVAGDKATQFEELKKLGFGEPILLDKNGNAIKE